MHPISPFSTSSSFLPVLLLVSFILRPTLALSIQPTHPQLNKLHFRPVPISSRSEPPLLFGRQLSSSVDLGKLASCDACQAVYETTSLCVRENPAGADNELQVPTGPCVCSGGLVSDLSACYSCAVANGADFSYFRAGMDTLSEACSNAGYSFPKAIFLSPPIAHPESALLPTPTASSQSSPTPNRLEKKTYSPVIKETVRWNSTHTASVQQAAATGLGAGAATSDVGRRRSSAAAVVGMVLFFGGVMLWV